MILLLTSLAFGQEDEPEESDDGLAEIEHLTEELAEKVQAMVGDEAAAQAATEAERIAGSWAPSYHFDEGVLTDADVTVTAESIAFAGQTIALNGEVPEGWQVD